MEPRKFINEKKSVKDNDAKEKAVHKLFLFVSDDVLKTLGRRTGQRSIEANLRSRRWRQFYNKTNSKKKATYDKTNSKKTATHTECSPRVVRTRSAGSSSSGRRTHMRKRSNSFCVDTLKKQKKRPEASDLLLTSWPDCKSVAEGSDFVTNQNTFEGVETNNEFVEPSTPNTPDTTNATQSKLRAPPSPNRRPPVFSKCDDMTPSQQRVSTVTTVSLSDAMYGGMNVSFNSFERMSTTSSHSSIAKYLRVGDPPSHPRGCESNRADNPLSTKPRASLSSPSPKSEETIDDDVKASGEKTAVDANVTEDSQCRNRSGKNPAERVDPVKGDSPSPPRSSASNRADNPSSTKPPASLLSPSPKSEETMDDDDDDDDDVKASGKNTPAHPIVSEDSNGKRNNPAERVDLDRISGAEKDEISQEKPQSRNAMAGVAIMLATAAVLAAFVLSY